MISLSQNKDFAVHLHHRQAAPVSAARLLADAGAWQGWRIEADPAEWRTRERGRNDLLLLDFGAHCVGSPVLCLEPAGRQAYDAPLRLRLVFAELPGELIAGSTSERGLSPSWIQEEVITVDLLPAEIELPRRYACRYLQIECTGFSGRYRIADVRLRTTTSADDRMLMPAPAGLDAELAAIDRTAIATMKSCMQRVFEDGPKRDRRLWLGDLKLQAMVNAVTYRNFDLVEHCLRLLADAVDAEAVIPGSVFDRPTERRGCDTLDYALLFGPTLLDHLNFSGREELVRELFELSLRQLDFVRPYFRDDRPVRLDGSRWVFIDHRPEIRREAAFTGIYIFSLKAHAELAARLGQPELARRLNAEAAQRSEAARRHHFRPSPGLAVSGPDDQLSYASQIWLILAGVLTPAEGAQALERIAEAPQAVRPASPYLWHYWLEAAFHCGMEAEAWRFIREYWGGMVRHGADTFWEIYVPDNPLYTPYGDLRLNSACHAWSCTPSWFIRGRR